MVGLQMIEDDGPNLVVTGDCFQLAKEIVGEALLDRVDDRDAGLPPSQAWWTVKRQSMTADRQDSVGLYFGTTSGELWMSRDEGHQWECLARHLPEIYAVEAAETAVVA